MKSYHQFILSLVMLAFICLNATAQESDLRTGETKIADILMQLPAQDMETLNRLMDELGGIPQAVPSLSSLLTEPGKGDDSKIRYALAGLSFYVSQQGDETRKAEHAAGFARAIETIPSDEIRDFLLIQLQYIAGNESLGALTPLLGHQRLCDPAARVLVRINTEEANQALLSALEKGNGEEQAIALTGALGDTRYQPALKTITKQINHSNPALRKTVLHALAEIASPSSQKLLYKAAQQSGFQYDPVDALGSYILYLSNLQKAGETGLLTKASKELFTKTDGKTQTAAKSAGLHFYVATQGEKALPFILQALDVEDLALQGAALQSAVSLNNTSVTNALIKKGEETTDAVLKANLILALGQTKDRAVLPFIERSMQSAESPVVQAAVSAYGTVDGNLSALPVLKAMNTADKEIVRTAKQVLLVNKTPELHAQIGAEIAACQPAARIALIEILAQRRASGQSPVVFAEAGSSVPEVALAAKKALQYLVNEKDISRIAGLMNQSPASTDLLPLQEAFYAAIKNSGDPAAQTSLVVDQMEKAPAQSQAYYNVLAMIGSDEGLKIVSEAFNSSNFNEQHAAFGALSRWNGFAAAPVLYQIALTNPDYKNDALTGYIGKVNLSKNTPEQKLLFLRKALEIATSDEQLVKIIGEMAKTNTLLSIITVGNYLDNTSSAVQQAAVQAVCRIAQSNSAIAGQTVGAIIEKAIALNKDPEAEYQKEAVMKQVDSWPEGKGWMAVSDLKELNRMYRDRANTDFELYLDRKAGAGADWETFFVRLGGNRVSVLVNGVPEKDAADALSYWGSDSALFPLDEKPAAGGVEYRDRYLREIARPQPYVLTKEEQSEGFVPMFNGIDMTGWTGNLRDYVAKDGMIVCDPQYGGRGNLYTEKEYADFIMRFDFLLTPAANNGLGIRTPLEGDAAYVGMELQILDNTAEVYKNLKEHQYHGSVYGVIAARKGALKPVGEWNTQEVIAQGDRIQVILNGTVILDGDIREASNNFTKTLDGRDHPGLSNPKGHIGFLGHGSYVSFRNLRIKDLGQN